MRDGKLVDMTSTGVESPVLVLYTDRMDRDTKYILTLKTWNPTSNKTGEAAQVLLFSRQPFLKGCNLEKTGNASYGCGCEIIGGLFYPVKLMYFYHFSNARQKTMFYFGSLPWIEFTLPSGSPSNNYIVYVTIIAVDSKGTVSKPHTQEGIRVEPRYKTTIGIYSIFIDISTLILENSAIELQRMRTLAWELNILPPNDIIRVLDNILALLFYRDECKDTINEQSLYYSVESFGFRRAAQEEDGRDANLSFKQKFLLYFEDRMGESGRFVRSNLLKSCARDQVVIKAAQIPSRDEVEVLMIITTLTVLVDAPENISWLTFQRVVKAMLNAKKHHMWFWDLQSEIRTEVAENYFILTSAVLNKEYEIYDCPSVPYVMINRIIDSLFDLMAKEITSRFLEEEPLSYISEYMKFDGYLTKNKNLNDWDGELSFHFLNDTVDMPGIHTVMALLHFQTPYSNSTVPINSNVLNLKLSWRAFMETKIEVFLPRSYLLTSENLDFRTQVSLDPERLSVYSFRVLEADLEKTLFVTLQLSQIYTPMTTVVLICEDLQSLDRPLLKKELSPQDTTLTMVSPPGDLREGEYLLVIMDQNSYQDHWARTKTQAASSGEVGGDFMLAVWWQQCFVWDNTFWLKDFCVPLNTSTWRVSHCICSSYSTTYGAVTEPLLTEGDQVPVNELMLFSSFVAFYFIAFLFAFYVVVFVFLYKKEKERTTKRNFWLAGNNPHHQYAYLLTINTGFQSNAGTFSTVFAILNGTDAMSATTQLQDKDGETLFTRGSVCSLILTSPESLGDILSVQLWHEDYQEGKGWFVCDVSVLDLQTGSRFVYPCYKWLSVASDDAQVMREIAMEKPTTFKQDFEHFLPQYMGEHTHWNALFTFSNLRKFFPLQSLTMFITVWVLLGTASLLAIKRINSSHTMMTPDPHIETLYCGFVIAVILLPVQGILRFAFKASNILEERFFYNRIIRAMTSKQPKRAKRKRATKPKRTGKKPSSKFFLEDESDFYDPNSDFWRRLSALARSFGPLDVPDEFVHPSFAQRVRENNEMELRQRRINAHLESDVINDAMQHPEASISRSTGEDDAPSSPSDRKMGDQGHLWKREGEGEGGDRRLDVDGDEAEERPRNDDAQIMKEETKDFFVSAAISMSIGWLISLACNAVCFSILLNQGSGMPKDYASLWVQTVFLAMCASTFLVQPLMVTLYTLYKVCLYRIFGFKTLIRLWTPSYFDHAITVWNYYKEKFKCEEEEEEVEIDEEEEGESKEEGEKEAKIWKDVKAVQRERFLRFAHPPPEHILTQHRSRFLMKRKISILIRTALNYVGFLILLVFIICHFDLQTRFHLNKTLRDSSTNGSCINRKANLYKAFSNITTMRDWYNWARTEFLDLTFNHDSNFTDFKLFCDSESVIIGTPRIRRYAVNPEKCEAKESNLNQSIIEAYHIRRCYPDYKDNVSHIYSIMNMQNPEYVWDAHYLSIIYGFFSDYSYTSEENMLPDNRIKAKVFLSALQSSQWLKRNRKVRGIVTEFLLYHVQSSLYSSVEFVAEFPSVSGANLSIFISSTTLNKHNSFWIYAFEHGDLLLVAVAMFLFKETCIELYRNKLKFWKTFWTCINFCVMILCWVYVICLMLRVHIAEDLYREIKLTYFTQYVNIKSLATWDSVLKGVVGVLMMVHIIRCLSLLGVIPRFRMYGKVLLQGIKESLKITGCVLFFLLVVAHFGYLLFFSYVDDFSTNVMSFNTIIRTLTFRNSFYGVFEKDSTSYQMIYGKLFFLLVFILLFFMVFGIYKAIFIYIKKNYVFQRDAQEITFNDIKDYLKTFYHSFKRSISTMFRPKGNTEPSSESNFSEYSLQLYISEMESLVETLKTRIDSLMESINIDTEEETLTNGYKMRQFADDNFTSSDTSATSLANFNNFNSGSSDSSDALTEREETMTNNPINFNALDDILSCPSELNPSTVFLLSEMRRKELSETNEHSVIIDNRDQISKFIQDTASMSTGQLQVLSHGKYGKTNPRRRMRQSLISFFNENTNFDLNDRIVYQNGKEEEQENRYEEEDTYFSPVPIAIEGIEELLAKYSTDGKAPDE